MADIFSTGPGYVVYDLELSGARTAELSADETKVIVAMRNGDIKVYDLASKNLLQTIDVAAQISAMTLSNDGTKAYVIGQATVGGATTLFEVNLATGASTTLPLSASISPTDIEFIAGNKLLLSAGQTYIYDLATKQASTPGGTNPVGFFGGSVMVESDGLVLIGETDTSSGPLQLYDETTGRVIGSGNSNQGGSPSGFNYGGQAVTREGGLVAQFIFPEHVEIYDLSLKLVTSLAYFGSYGGGLAFDSQGDYLLAYRPGQFGATLAAFDTTSWTSALLVDVRAASSFHSNAGSGEAIAVTSSNSHIVLTDAQDGFVQIVALTSPLGSSSGVVGSNSDDSLSAVQGQDVDGRGGHDRLSISFRDATAPVSADFRGLQNGGTVLVEGGTITSIEEISLVEGSDFADFLAPYAFFGTGGTVINGYGGDDHILISLQLSSFGPTVDGGAGNDLIDARGVSGRSFFIGGDGDDVIYTTNGGSSVAGGGIGNDTLHSWGTAEGGAGNDTIFLYRPGDVSGATVTGLGSEGDDAISVAANVSPGDSVSFVLAGEGGADILTGGAANDFLTSVGMTGNFLSAEDAGAERDTLSGGDGNDRLNAGYGDTIDGGGGDDVLILSLAAASAGVTVNTQDFVGATPVNVGGGFISNIEYIDQLYATDFDDTITVGGGGALPQSTTQVHGRGGNDTFIDGGTAAFFYGDSGNDRMLVQPGSVFGSFYGGSGVDTVDYTTYTSGVTVTLASSLLDSSASGNGSDGVRSGVLFEIENVEGSAHADRITGSREANIIRGLGGNDVLAGGFGADSLYGGAGEDRIILGAEQFGPASGLADGGTGSDVLEVNGFVSATFSAAGIEHLQFAQLSGSALSQIQMLASIHANFLLNINLVGGESGEIVLRLDDRNSFDASGISRTATTHAGATLAAGDQVTLVLLGNSAAGGTITGSGGRDTIFAGNGSSVLSGLAGNDLLVGSSQVDTLVGGRGDDTLTGGSNVDTARFSGNRDQYTITQTATGIFQISGTDGADTLTTIEFAQFADQTVRLLPGTGTTVDFNASPATYMAAIRDFDGNDLGAAADWVKIGAADVNGDGDIDQIFTNRTNGRFAEVATGPDGKVYFADHGWAGETRVVGIYIDPLVQSGAVVAGSDTDSQRRFQNDLYIGNIAEVLGADDFDGDGLQEVYFALTDGTAYLHAYMHADGNIRYANYQSEQQVIDFLTAEGFNSSTWAGWFD